MVKEVASAAADSCSPVAAGVAGPNPVSDLVLEAISLRPKAATAPTASRTSPTSPMRRTPTCGTPSIGPLQRIEATRTSPLFGLMIAMALQAEAQDEPAGCGVILGDAIAVEDVDGHRIDFRRRQATADEKAGLEAVVEQLKPLAGGTIVLAGAGGHSSLDPERILRARAAIDATLKAARIRTVWTRSPALPKECKS